MGIKHGSSSSSRTLSGRRPGLLAVLLTLVSLALAACGEEATPGPPPQPTLTPAPTPRFQLATEQRLLFTMNIPTGWNRTDLDSTSVVWTSPRDTNLAIGVVSRGAIQRLTSDSQRIAQERVDQLKARFPGLKEDANSTTINLGGTNLPVYRLSYTNTQGVDVIQYMTQVNNVGADRAYVLFAVTTTREADSFRPVFLDAFRSFNSLAGNVARPDETLADPTVVAALNGGVVRPPGADRQYRILRLVEWESPPLNARLKTPRLTGLFPLEFKWRLRPFPSIEQPAIYLESPKVDRNTSEAVMQIGVYKDALPAGNLTADDWRKFYQPTLERIVNLTLKSYAPNVTIGEIQPVPAPPPNAKLYRVLFTARDDSGEVQARGVVLFGRSEAHGIAAVVSLSPYASLKQELVDAYTADFETIISSLSVKF